MLRSILICFLAMMTGLRSSSQAKSELVASIRKEFQAINADKTLSKKTLRDEEFMENVTDGGGELTGYYKKGILVKIVEWIGLSYGNRTREYYFKGNNVFFVYEKFESFVIEDSTKAEIDHSRVTLTFEGRYYFDKNKLITQKITGKRTLEEDPAEVIKELLDTANQDRKSLK